MTAYDAFQEVYYWYSGAASYTFPAIILFIGIILFVKSEDMAITTLQRRVLFGIALFSLFLVGGGTLALVGVVCYSLLVWLVIIRINTGKWHWSNLFLFLPCFMGALITVAAPGNYARQAVGESIHESSFLLAIVNTYEAALSNIEWLFHKRTLPLFLLIIFFIGLTASSALLSKLKGLLVGGVLLLFNPYVCIFPVVYGYAENWVPNRCVFILVMSILFSYSILALAVGALSWQLLATHCDKRLIQFLLILCSCLYLCVCDFRITENRFYQTAHSLVFQEYQENYTVVRAVVEGLKDHEGEDVELTWSDDINSLPNFLNFYLMGDTPNDAFNGAIAYLYKLNSLTRIQPE